MGKRVIKVKKFKRKGSVDIHGEIDALLKKENGSEEVVTITQKEKVRQLYVKTGRNKFIALINRKNGSAIMLQIPTKYKSISFEGNSYFMERGGIYNLEPKNKMIATYYEGACLPVRHSYIVYEKHNVLLTDRNGNNVKIIDDKIDPNEIRDLPKDNEGNLLRTKDTGFIIKKVLDRIKGLEFDSVIANTIFHSGLIEKFGRAGKMEKWTFLLFIFSLINLITIIGIGIVLKVT